MLHATYEEIVRFASDGEFVDELKKARGEYEQRTGQLLESDADFERRIAAFIEWYVLDRPVSGVGVPPIVVYISRHANKLGPENERDAEALRSSFVSLFEYRGTRREHLHFDDVLVGKKHRVLERRKAIGLESKDILEARLVPIGESMMVFDTWVVHPRQARKTILKVAKTLRKGRVQDDPQKRIDWVHRVAFFSNRCARYKHVDPAKIFAELVKS